MKSIALLAAIVLLLCSTLGLQADPGTTVALFQASGFTYGYESWKDLSTSQSTGADAVHITGPATGGVGIFLNKLADLTGSKFLEIKIKRGVVSNHADLLVKLFDGAGHTTQWNIKADDIPTDSFKTIQLPFDPKPTIDLEEIKQVQIQGDFNPGHTADFYVASIISS